MTRIPKVVVVVVGLHGAGIVERVAHAGIADKNATAGFDVTRVGDRRCATRGKQANGFLGDDTAMIGDGGIRAGDLERGLRRIHVKVSDAAGCRDR